jgi:hypothetical protein
VKFGTQQTPRRNFYVKPHQKLTRHRLPILALFGRACKHPTDSNKKLIIQELFRRLILGII